MKKNCVQRYSAEENWLYVFWAASFWEAWNTMQSSGNLRWGGKIQDWDLTKPFLVTSCLLVQRWISSCLRVGFAARVLHVHTPASCCPLPQAYLTFLRCSELWGWGQGVFLALWRDQFSKQVFFFFPKRWCPCPYALVIHRAAHADQSLPSYCDQYAKLSAVWRKMACWRVAI